MREIRSPLCAVVLLAVCALVPSNVGASFLGEEIYVPSVGRGSGAAGSVWYTTVWFHNPGPDPAVVSVALLLRDQANLTPDTQNVTVQAGSTLTYSDALLDLFGLETVVGALRVRTTGQIAVGSRVFNQQGDQVSESQGQLMAGVPASLAIRPGDRVEVPGVVQPADGSFRSNFGLVETSGSTTLVEVSFLDNNGVSLASDTLTLMPYSAFQQSLASFAPGVSTDQGIIRVEVLSPAGAVIAYASAVANGVESQDPTTLDMTLALQPPGGGGCLGERQEVPINEVLIPQGAGEWYGGGDELRLPGPGRWRVGYRVLVELYNSGVGTASDLVTVALWDATRQEVIRGTLSVLGYQIDLVSGMVVTVSAETVIEVDRATTILIAARTSRGSLQVAVHPHDVDVSAGLSHPDAASFLFSECLDTDD
jgi:hypothetical protein